MRSQWKANLIYKNADISVFLTGTNIPATVYADPTGGEAIDKVPQAKSDSNGVGSFYVDTENYGLDQRFDIKINRIGTKYSLILSNVKVFNTIAYIDTKESLSNKNVANGYAGRDADNDTTTSVDIGDYGEEFTTYTLPTGSEGAIRIVVNTNHVTPGKRLYVYANSIWSYVTLI